MDGRRREARCIDAPAAAMFNLGALLRDQLRNIAPFATLLFLVGFFTIAAPSFATLGNLENILQQVSVTAIIAVGLTFVILTAEIDLSVGAIANATAIVLTFFTMQPDLRQHRQLPAARRGWRSSSRSRPVSRSALVTAFGVTRIGIPSFIMTLAMMQIGAGISRGAGARADRLFRAPAGADARLEIDLGRSLDHHRRGAALLVAHFVLTYTRFGRYVYMVGGNREAAEYSGVNVRLIIGAVMTISAVCSGLAGMLGVAYFGSAQQNEFDTFLLDAIAAVVVGGTSLFGGRGGIGNTIVGLFVLGVLNNGLDYVKIDSFLKILIRGLILLVALVINVYAERIRATREVGP